MNQFSVEVTTYFTADAEPDTNLTVLNTNKTV